MCINRAVRSMRQRNVEGHIFNINRYCCSRATSCSSIVHPLAFEPLRAHVLFRLSLANFAEFTFMLSCIYSLVRNVIFFLKKILFWIILKMIFNINFEIIRTIHFETFIKTLSCNIIIIFETFTIPFNIIAN